MSETRAIVALLACAALFATLIAAMEYYTEYQTTKAAMENGYEQVYDNWGRTTWKKITNAQR